MSEPTSSKGAKGGPLKALVLLAALFAVLMVAGAAVTPPPVRPAGAPGFDAHAAQGRLARILGDQRPHPIDSAAQDAVRANLLREIEAMGLKPEVHEAFACRPYTRGPLIECGHVRNIVFSIGPESGPSVLAAGHYDSVPAGPGATDDGIGTSVLLEVAREMAHAHLTRRVIFLLSDGEEQALLGAYEFAQHDPLMQSVQSMVELEARGTRGPAVFFESNQPNADAVNAYASVARPVANSIMADVYHLLPNSTDVSVLTRPGLDVINIAVLDGLWNYHTPQDTIATQDLRSVQHMGDQALAIVTRLASAPDAGNRQTLVYTDILSRFFISAPAWLAHAVLALSALVAFGAFWSGGADRRWRTLGLTVLSLVFAALLGAAVWALVDFVIRPGDMYWWAHPEVARAWCIALGLLGAPLAMLTLRGGLRSAQLGASGQFWFAALGALLALLLPGISILFVVPAALYALGVVIGFAWKPARPVGAMLAALTSLLIWAPMLALNELALGFQFPFANTMLFALTALPWLGLLAELQGAARWRWTALALGAVGAVGIVLAVLTPAATPDRPLPLNFYYFLNTTTHDARVLAGSAKRSLPAPVISAMAFAPQLMLPGDKVPYWAAPATMQAVAAPAFENMTVEARGDARVMHATLRMNGVYRVFIRIPLAAGASKVRLNGVDADFRDTGASMDDSDYVTLACQGRACDGVDVEITLDAGAQDWSLIGITSGVSGQAASIPRPADRTAIQFGDSTVTLTMLHV